MLEDYIIYFFANGFSFEYQAFFLKRNEKPILIILWTILMKWLNIEVDLGHLLAAEVNDFPLFSSNHAFNIFEAGLF